MSLRLLVALPVLLAACVSTATHDEVLAERDSLVARVAELEGQVATLEAEKRRLEAQAEAARAEGERVARRQAQLAEARASLGLTEGQAMHATFRTSLGDIRCELWPDVAPKTVQNFVGLAEGTREWTHPRTQERMTTPLYNGTAFHRVIPDFMIQGGDPLGNGRGGPGYRFEDEVTPEVAFTTPGLLAMANSGPNTNGSQFFITDSTPTHLNGRHTIFGKCELDVVRRIMAVPLEAGGDGARSKPVDPITLQTVVIERG